MAKKGITSLEQMKKYQYGLVFLPLIIGIITYYLEEANYITPGSYFGSSGWPNMTIGLAGLFLWFYSIPKLLNHSYNSWKSKKYLWILDLLFIIPFYLIGLYFQIGLGYFALLTIFLGPFILIFIILKKLYKIRNEWKSNYFIILMLITLVMVFFIISFFEGGIKLEIIKIWLRQNYFH